VSPTGSLLLVDDEERILKNLSRALRDEGHEVVATTNADDVPRLLGERPFDVLVIDNRMPRKTGLEILRDLAGGSDADRPQVVMMTAHATVESAIEAMRLGAFDYLQKPFDVDELLVVVGRALEHQRLRTQHRYLLAERDEGSLDPAVARPGRDHDADFAAARFASAHARSSNPISSSADLATFNVRPISSP